MMACGNARPALCVLVSFAILRFDLRLSGDKVKFLVRHEQGKVLTTNSGRQGTKAVRNAQAKKPQARNAAHPACLFFSCHTWSDCMQAGEDSRDFVISTRLPVLSANPLTQGHLLTPRRLR